MSTLSGLKTALPSSLIQISSRRSVSTGALRPPATSASESCRQRSERLRSGSPSEKRVPSPWRTTPGASSSVEQYTTQPIARSGAIAALVAPPGSTASMRRPSYGPPWRWKYHHGTPFCAPTIAVRVVQERRQQRPAGGVGVGLEAEEDDVHGADLGGIVGRERDARGSRRAG